VGSPDHSDPLKAGTCTDRTVNATSVTSYRVYFRRVSSQ
jgi:hypothetical protein